MSEQINAQYIKLNTKFTLDKCFEHIDSHCYNGYMIL